MIVAYVVQYEGKLLDCGDDFTVSIQNMISDCDVCPYSPRQFKSEEIRNEPVELSLIGTFSQVSLYPDVWMAQIGDDEAHSGKQFSLVPLHLRDHSPSNVPALGLVDEVMIGDDGLRGKPLRRPY